jgi:uncharacterized RDD family membrane protein YckC
MTESNFPVIKLSYKTNLRKRVIASLLDYSVFLIPACLYILVFGHDNVEGGKTVSGLLAIPLPICWFLYFVVVESVYGGTLAHQALNLKVVTLKRDIPNWTQNLKRHLLDPIDILFFGIPAIISIRNTDKHQRLGDLWAETIVVDIKDPEQYTVCK